MYRYTLIYIYTYTQVQIIHIISTEFLTVCSILCRQVFDASGLKDRLSVRVSLAYACMYIYIYIHNTYIHVISVYFEYVLLHDACV